MIDFILGPWGKLIGVGIGALALWWAFNAFTGHYEAIGEARANASMQKKVDEQRELKEAAEKLADANRIKAEKYHDQLVKDNADYYRSISGSLRDIKATVGGLDLSGAMENSRLAGDPAAVASAVAEFKAAVAAFTDGVDRATDSCFADATELAAILRQAQLNGALEGTTN